MARFIVTAREIWTQRYVVDDELVETRENAIAVVANGDAEPEDNTLTFSDTCDTDTWEVEED